MLKVRRVKIQRRLALIAFLEDALTGPQKPPQFVSVLQALWVVSPANVN
jgi:hypothetical protein